MRSRDGLQIKCVVCEPKLVEISTESDKLESGKPQFSPQTPKVEVEKFHFDSFPVSSALLFSLNCSLDLTLSTETFADILESALKPLKNLPIKKDSPNDQHIQAIDKRIIKKLERV